MNNSDLDKNKKATPAPKSELKAEQNKIVKIQAFESTIFYQSKLL